MLQVALHPALLHFKQPAATSRGALTTRQIFLLCAWDTAAPGILGWGECGPIPHLSRDDRPDFAAAIQRACTAINTARAPFPVTNRQSPVTRHLSPVTFHLPSFTFALETALRDLASGGCQRLWDTPFARGDTGLPTHGLIWMDSAAGLLGQIEAKVAQGCRVLKLKVGALPFAEEIDLLRTVRQIYPASSVELRLDANGAFGLDEALAKLEALAEFDIAFLEQPLQPGQWPALAALCRQSPIPIALDEELIPIAAADDRQRLLDSVRPQHLILKPALLGGFGACEAWIADATERGSQWWSNSLLESNIGLNAICQWTSAVGGERTHGLGTGGLFTNNIPSPIRSVGCSLVLDRVGVWELPAV